MRNCNVRFHESQWAESVFWSDFFDCLRKESYPLSMASEDELCTWLSERYFAIFAILGLPLSFFNDKIVVEIGSGPFGAVNKLSAKIKVAVDPLMQVYAAQYKQFWDKSVYRIYGQGEDMKGLNDSWADIVIVLNALDHSENPRTILSECHRILKHKGILILSNNVKSFLGSILGNVAETGIYPFNRMREIHHPHHFHRKGLEVMLKSSGFTVGANKFMLEVVSESHKEDRVSLKNRLKYRLLKEREVAFLLKKS